MEYWWNVELGNIRKEVVGCRREVTRARKRKVEQARIVELEARCKERKQAFKKRIRARKRECWKKLCVKLEEDIFGDAYKIVQRELSPYRLEMSTQERWRSRLCYFRRLTSRSGR